MIVDPLHDINHYSPTMTILQVIKFLEKKGLAVSRAMVQNYIRDGLLPPPVDKRKYTHKHLAALVIITRLKAVFEIRQVKEVLAPLLDDEGLPLEVYRWLTGKTEDLAKIWNEQVGTAIKSETSGMQLLLFMNHAVSIINFFRN